MASPVASSTTWSFPPRISHADPGECVSHRTSHGEAEVSDSEDELVGGVPLPFDLHMATSEPPTEETHVEPPAYDSATSPLQSLSSAPAPVYMSHIEHTLTASSPHPNVIASSDLPFEEALATLSLNFSAGSTYTAAWWPPPVTLPAHQTYTFNQVVDDLFDFDEDGPSVSDHHNTDISKFLYLWRMTENEKIGLVDTVGPEANNVKKWRRPRSITSKDLQGDKFDIQGIDWEALETTRRKAKSARKRLYTSASTRSEISPSQSAARLSNTESYFRFRRMNTEHRAWIEHYQLRNLLSATSRNDIYYATKSCIMRTDASGQTKACVMDLTEPSFDSPNCLVTTLATFDDTLIVGGLQGEYAITNLVSEYDVKPVKGFVTHEFNGITNHVDITTSRTNSNLHAVFSSNDSHVRVLDCYTNQFIHDFTYPAAINCSATSPNGRMRVLVGDLDDVLITDAATGRPFEHLRGHRAHAFSCAWADDGIHVATGAQDSQIVIYDARRWDRPLAQIATGLATARSLRFSPVGGGKRVLLAAEADDVVSVIDAEAFDRKQVLDQFGRIGGAAFTPDGARFFIANCDATFGGIAEFERAGYGERCGVEPSRRIKAGHWGFGEGLDREGPNEWVEESALDSDLRVRCMAKARRRRGLGLGEVIL